MLTANRPANRRIVSAERKDDTLYMRSAFGTLALKPVADNIVKVMTTVRSEFSGMERPGVIYDTPFPSWQYTENEDYVELKLNSVTARVSRESASVSFYDNEGKALFRERDKDPVEFEEFTVYRLADVEQKTRIIETADGKKEVIDEPSKEETGKSYHIRMHFVPGDEALYGMGQQEKGFASLRGRTLYIHQANRKIAVPMFVSTAGYGILTDTYAPMIMKDCSGESYLYLEADKELVYYLIAGDMNSVIRGYRKLTGKASMLPKWAYGYIQSQERYESRDEILEIVSKSRELGIGMDCIVLDWMSWKDGEWGQKSYDPGRFPDPKGMIDTLHDMHVHFMLSIWPTMTEGTPDHREFAERGLFLPACSVYNALNADARKLYFDQLKRTHVSYGTDAWWCDSSEPFTPEWSHPMRMEEGELFHAYCSESGLRMPYEYSDAFPLYHAMGIYENWREAGRDYGTAGKRVCNLTRSAYTGQQRYGTIMWSGDTDASWETFRDQIAIGLHFCASGLPYWTMDTGAFFVKHGDQWFWNGHYDDTTEDEDYCELYTRWYQYAAFLPVFRAHGTDCRRELWNFKGRYYDAMLAANRLRYSLMPYIYSEAGKVWLYDNSFIRWLSFDFTDDRNTWDITDQYMFGGSLMVCPVTHPLSEACGRKVYLPSGTAWYDLYSGKRYEGGMTIDVRAPLDMIPVFVKDNSVIPMRKAALSTEEQDDEIVFKRFCEGTASYEYFEDDGDGYAYENGGYRLKNITV